MSGGFWPHNELLLRAVLDWSYRRIVGGHDPMTAARPESDLAAATGETITPDGIGGFEALRLFTQVLVPATRDQADPMNLAYVPAAPTEAALVFDLAVSAAEIFGGVWEAGAGAIHAENQALAWLADLAGFPDTAGGCFMSGATVGNLSALVAGRETARSRRRGLKGRWCFAATKGAHSSIRSAATVMDCDVLDVDTDERGRMTGDNLAKALEGHDEPNLFAVVATAGTTNAGQVDELEPIAELCRERGLWLHVDAAYGGAALAAPSVRPLFNGIERADSFVVDPHKWLFSPYDCCALLYRDPRKAAEAHAQTATYLDQIDRQVWNPADFGIHLSRRARGLPFWFSLATYGTDRYRDAVEQVLTLTRRTTDEIRRRKELRLAVEPDLSVVLFERKGWSQEDYDNWSRRAARAGIVLSVPTKWAGRDVFRFCFVNPDTRFERIRTVLDSLGD